MYIPKVEKIKERRERKGLSKKRTSLNAGLPANALCKVENRCSTSIHPIRARAIAQALECEVCDIFEVVPCKKEKVKK